MQTYVSIQNQYQSLVNDLGAGYSDFLYTSLAEFYSEHNLPSIYFTEDGFSQGDATINDLVDLKTKINERYGDDKNSAVYFEVERYDDKEYQTDIFNFLDSKFMAVLEKKLEQYKIDKRDQIVDILLDLVKNPIDNPNLTSYYVTMNELHQYIQEAGLNEDDEDYLSDLETTVANFVDYDSNFSKYF
jgi:hypothetical protein